MKYEKDLKYLIKRVIAVIDIDTTIANNDHRAAVLKKVCKQCNAEVGSEHTKACPSCGHNRLVIPQECWDKFLDPELLQHDTPQAHSLDVINFMRKQGYQIVYLTGRNEKTREATEAWLTTHGYLKVDDVLAMRPVNCRDAASKAKENMFLELEEELFSPSATYLFFEDDKHVLQTWRKYGLVFECPAAWEHMNPNKSELEETVWNR